MQIFSHRSVRNCLIGAAATLALGLGATGQSYAQTQITFSYLWGGAEGQALEEIIADFNASQTDIVVTGVSSPDSTKQLASMSSARGAFDISDNFASNVAAWADQGILLPLNDLGNRYDRFPRKRDEAARG